MATPSQEPAAGRKGGAVMPKFIVTVPIAGAVHFEVMAKNEEEALRKIEEDTPNPADDMIEWEYFFNGITNGNVLHASCNEVSVNRVKKGNM